MEPCSINHDQFVTKEVYNIRVIESNEKHSSLSAKVEEMWKRAESDYNLLDSKISNRVTYRQFIWIVATLLTVLLSTFGYIASQISDIRRTTEVTSSDVSTIKGKLDPYNIKFN